MSKEFLFAQIAKCLESGGMDEESVKKSISALSDAFSASDDETFEKKIKASGGAEGIASQLLAQYNKENAEKEDGSEETAEAEETENTSGDDEKSDDEKVKNLNILLDDDMFSDDGEPIKTEERAEEEQTDADEFFSDESEAVSKTGKNKPVKVDLAKKKKNKSAAKKKKPLTERGKTVYILSLCLLIPLIVAVIAALTVIILALYIGFAVLAIVCSVALVLIAALGTALSIVAIVYGVIQLSVAVPIGLYEMGIGIVVGGATLAASILLYNFVVRFVPFMFRALFVFYRFLCRQISKLIGLVRGACSKL
ncbi:MAG: hypothetical protein II135_00610 [Clostridia bacterium]|nr:hypothetical protein [Clostridia bacterium]MBQ3869627.1 hypothetical protein [Clostridia bacterium]